MSEARLRRGTFWLSRRTTCINDSSTTSSCQQIEQRQLEAQRFEIQRVEQQRDKQDQLEADQRFEAQHRRLQTIWRPLPLPATPTPAASGVRALPR